MNAKKFIIGGFVAGIAYFLLGWLMYGNLLMNFFKEHPGLTIDYERPEPMFQFLIIGNLMTGFLLSYVFTKAKINSFGNGFISGGMIGFFMSSGYDSMQYALTTLTSKPAVLADVLTFTAISAITGAITAIASGTGDPDTT